VGGLDAQTRVIAGISKALTWIFSQSYSRLMTSVLQDHVWCKKFACSQESVVDEEQPHSGRRDVVSQWPTRCVTVADTLCHSRRVTAAVTSCHSGRRDVVSQWPTRCVTVADTLCHSGRHVVS